MTNDAVNLDDDGTAISPEHYARLDPQPIEIIEAWVPRWDPRIAFHLASVLKYVARAGFKGDAIEDLRKASWYLQRAIVVLEQEKDT